MRLVPALSRAGLLSLALGKTLMGISHSITHGTIHSLRHRYPRKRLVILGGQSNAVGVGNTANLTDSSYADVYPAVKYKWQVATGATNPPRYNTRSNFGSLAPIQSNLFGREASLGRTLNASESNVWYIAKFAVSETSFVSHWLPTSTYPTSDPNGINLYTRFKNFVQTAISEADTDDVTLVWVHGESDCRTSGGPQNYADNF